jgi:hypothetical protein
MFGRTFLLCLVCFYEIERKRRKIVVLVSPVEKCSSKRMVARALQKAAKGSVNRQVQFVRRTAAMLTIA